MMNKLWSMLKLLPVSLAWNLVALFTLVHYVLLWLAFLAKRQLQENPVYNPDPIWTFGQKLPLALCRLSGGWHRGRTIDSDVNAWESGWPIKATLGRPDRRHHEEATRLAAGNPHAGRPRRSVCRQVWRPGEWGDRRLLPDVDAPRLCKDVGTDGSRRRQSGSYCGRRSSASDVVDRWTSMGVYRRKLNAQLCCQRTMWPRSVGWRSFAHSPASSGNAARFIRVACLFQRNSPGAAWTRNADPCSCPLVQYTIQSHRLQRTTTTRHRHKAPSLFTRHQPEPPLTWHITILL